MQEFKIIATLIFFPTIILAAYICYKTWHTKVALLINLSVFCWISANSCWMFDEFYFPFLKPFALVFFLAGLGFISIYLFNFFVKNQEEETPS
jgi:hypothetical protein